MPPSNCKLALYKEFTVVRSVKFFAPQIYSTSQSKKKFWMLIEVKINTQNLPNGHPKSSILIEIWRYHVLGCIRM